VRFIIKHVSKVIWQEAASSYCHSFVRRVTCSGHAHSAAVGTLWWAGPAGTCPPLKMPLHVGICTPIWRMVPQPASGQGERGPCPGSRASGAPRRRSRCVTSMLLIVFLRFLILAVRCFLACSRAHDYTLQLLCKMRSRWRWAYYAPPDPLVG